MRHKEGCSAPPAGMIKVRKASYYVWFLGAEECRGLRGAECVRPVVQYLINRERTQEPDKVTLQVSSRGIKLLQTSSGSRNTIKHFMPASAVTYVQQEGPADDDIVSAILLIYNPLTRCPVHVHTYRCDSTETAGLLRDHLAQLVEQPEQQAKLAALEARLAARGLLPPPSAVSRASDGASTGSSASSGGGGSCGRSPPAVPAAAGTAMATLYDSLAAELREKLSGRGAPLLLPPKDYDTFNRSRGRVPDTRSRPQPPAAARKSQEDDSARSSGIGSDDAPSPTQDRELEPVDNQSSSDEEWERHGRREVQEDPELILMQPSWQGRENPVMVPGHPVRGTSRGTQPQGYIARNQSPTRGRARGVHNSPPGGRHSPPGGRHSPPGGRHSPPGGRHSPPGGRHSPPGGRHPSPTRAPRDVSPIRPVHHRRTRRQNNRDRSESPVSPRERFQDARDKFRSLERDWQRSDRPECHARPQVHAGVCRTPSWEHKPGAGGRDTRAPHEHATRDEGVWPKSDRDTGYGSRDGLLRERPRGREYDRGYGTCDTRDSEPWHCAGSPSRVPRGRSPTKDYRVPRVKSPERPDYHRAKSMHDLNQRSVNEDDPRSCNDPRRRSMYDTAEDPRPLRESRSDRRYRSQASLRRRNSCSSGSCPSVDSYNEIPDTRRFPGLDRATARPDPLETTRGPTHFIHVNKRTYDYPVNGGTAAVHINRAQHDDYRRFRYDHTTTPQFIRTTSVPAAHY